MKRSPDHRLRLSRRALLGGLAVLPVASSVGCAPQRAAEVPPNVPRTGASQPQLVIEEIGDYECSFCSAVQPAVRRLLATHGDRITLVWRNYPLARHPFAALAAEAALEVHAQRGDPAFWRFHETLLLNQTRLDRPSLERYASAIAGVDRARLGEALDAGLHRPRLAAERAQIDALQIPNFGTPAFLIGEDAFIGAYSHEELAALVEEKL